MSNTQQILRSKKVVNAKDKGLTMPILLESEKQTYAEYNVFKRINQLDQFYIDKLNCNFYRFYGHINEVVNLKYDLATQPIVKPDFTYFDISTVGNWDVYLMTPLSFSTGATPTSEDRGDYIITTTFDGVVKTIDFNAGLPALSIKNEVINNKNRIGLLMYLGHNYQTGDLLSLADTDSPSKNGTYRVVYVVGNKVYLQEIAVATPTSGTTTSGVTTDYVKIGDGEVELGITPTYYYSLLSRSNVNWLAVITPHIFVKKLVNKIPCEYYMKKLHSVGKIGNITNCGYSNNSYNQKTFSFTNEGKSYFQELLTNNKAPVTDLYITFVKLVSEDLNMTTIQANFSNFTQSTFDENEIKDYYFSNTKAETILMPAGSMIYEAQQENVFVLLSSTFAVLDGDVTKAEVGAWSRRSGALYTSKTAGASNKGIQTVSEHFTDELGIYIDYTDPNNSLYHSLVEYSNETLTEVEINHIEHTFICNTTDIQANHMRFGYNPFHHVPIRKFSNNVEEWDVYFGIPNYAVYSEKYQTYRWRHILEIGYFEAGGNGIDFPYMNDAFYVFSHILFNIKNYSSPKVNSLLTGGYLISAYTDTLTQDQTNTTNTTGNSELDDSLLDKNKNDKPFEEFSGTIC
jgi:hypothetical protein